MPLPRAVQAAGPRHSCPVLRPPFRPKPLQINHISFLHELQKKKTPIGISLALNCQRTICFGTVPLIFRPVCCGWLQSSRIRRGRIDLTVQPRELGGMPTFHGVISIKYHCYSSSESLLSSSAHSIQFLMSLFLFSFNV